MKPATNDYLQAADRALDKSRIVHGVGLFDEAGRHAYYAMFHAAQATIFERTSRIAKTHRGVSRQFHLICMSDPQLGTELSSGLSRAYQFKEMADYEVGTIPPVSPEEATAALDTAKKFVAQVRQVIEARDQTAS